MIQVRSLSVHFGTQPAVQDLNMLLLPGQVTALVGESGSGKSITSLAMMGLLPPQATATGQVLLDGTDLLADHRAQAHARGRDLAMIFQEPMSCLNPVRRIGSQATEGLRLGGMPARQAEQHMLDLFGQVHLPRPQALLRSYPHQLSGGQLQRIMIAMALSTRPRLILADEPTTALDVSVQQDILALCRTLVEGQQRSMLFVSHDLRLVQQLAHRVVVLYRGRVVEQGEAQQVLAQPTHPYTQALLQCRPRPAHRGYRLPTVSDFAADGASPPLPVPLAPTQPGQVLLSLQAVAKTYPGRPPVPALQDIHLELRAGHTLGLVGESGCGKSTLARILAGLEAPTAGSVLYLGERLPPQPRPQALVRAVQMVFQDPSGSLNPRRTVGQTLAEPLLVHGLASRAAVAQQVAQLLAQVGLPTHYAGRYPYQLSGGQCQRVGIARALALQPRVLICDESVAALDVSVQAQVLNLLNELKAALGLSLLFVSHDLAVVHYMADDIAVMDGGRIVEYGPADEVLHAPQAELTRRLVAAAQ